MDFTELGTQYFYATQFSPEGAKTFFIFLNKENEEITTRDDGEHGWTCHNTHCCEKCVAHDSLICTCHTTEPDCIVGTQVATCKQDIAIIN